MDLKFELNKLIDYSKQSIIEEIKRVASITPPDKTLTTKLFDQYSKVSSSTIIRKFGSWGNALILAGVENRFSNSKITDAMKKRMVLKHSKDEVIAELKRASFVLGLDSYTTTQFSSVSDLIDPNTISRKFGSWADAMHAAGLKPTKRAIRYTQDDYLENILVVWTYYRRQPTYSEMGKYPSTITPGAYEAKFGKWTNALKIFVETIGDKQTNPKKTIEIVQKLKKNESTIPKIILAKELGRTIPLGLRYRVLKRDNFKCVLCGDSPATNVQCKLHVDHIVPWSRNGKTEESNLRTLCEKCNVGRSNLE